MKRWWTIVGVGVVVLLAAFALQISADNRQAGSAERYAEMPWHLVDIWWDIGQDRPFESYSIDLTLDSDVPAATSLYIAPVGLGHLGKSAFYGGFQTQVNSHTKRDPTVRTIGRGLIFSMWGERSLAAIRAADGGFCQSSGHEGDFIGVRRPYAWKKGRYTYRLVRMDEELIDGRPYTWVGAFVYSHEKDENVWIGALRFKGENLTLSRQVASFIELYGRPVPVSEIPKVVVTFGRLELNGKPVERPTAAAVYPEGVPDYAAATTANGMVVVDVGRHFKGRTERQVDLLKR